MARKLFKVFIIGIILCVFSLTGCDDDSKSCPACPTYPDVAMTNLDIVTEDAFALTSEDLTLASGDTVDAVTDDFALPETGLNGSVVQWASNNAAVAISGNSAIVSRPYYPAGDLTVTLTATIVKGVESTTKDIAVILTQLPQRLIIYSIGSQHNGDFTETVHQSLCDAANTNLALGLSQRKPFISRDGSNIKDISGVPTAIEVNLSDGTSISSNWAGLWEGIDNPLSSIIDNDWWSGSDSDGTASTNNCNNWSDSSGSVTGMMASRTQTSTQWLSWAGTLCQWSRYLLCVGWD